jgi:hypothetical protein
VGSSQQVLVLEAVVRLDHELTSALGHLDLLRSRTTELLNTLRARICTVVDATREVRERVLACGDETAIEDGESVLHARAALVAVQLAELREVERELAPTALEPEARFRTVPELSAYLLDHIGRVNARWLQERRDLKAAPHDDASYNAHYHVVLDNAEHGFAAIGKDPDVRRFLRIGSFSDSKRFRLACRTIATALDLPSVPELPRLRALRVSTEVSAR